MGNIREWKAEEIESAKKLRNELLFDEETLEDDIEMDYITVHQGRDGKTYVWYIDEAHNAVLEIGTDEVIEDDDFIEKNFC